jgi:HlyD family secretion protein
MTMRLLGRPTSAVSSAGEPTDADLLGRFVGGRDHHAFADLVRRHGPMVFGVCRRILRDPHDAEEAFQVTFLVLVRKAGQIGRPERLANWLYGVAHRVSRKARVTAARRGAHERAASLALTTPVTVGPDQTELRAVLDEELVTLPEKYRAPLVLCYLEGLTNEEAARRLGWPPGSMSYRLARGRELLRRRLARRGLVCVLLWPVFLQVLTERAHAGTVPDELVRTTVDRARQEATTTPAPAPSRRGGVPTVVAIAILLLLGLGAAAVAGWAVGPADSQADVPSSPACSGGAHAPAEAAP